MDRGNVVDETTRVKITPSDIDASKHLFDAFDNYETEVSARYIVRMCQEQERWFAFTQEEIEEFYTRNSKSVNFSFNRLVDPGRAYRIRTGMYLTGGGWVILGEDGKYRVTEEFIDNCYRSSPAHPCEVHIP